MVQRESTELRSETHCAILHVSLVHTPPPAQDGLTYEYSAPAHTNQYTHTHTHTHPHPYVHTHTYTHTHTHTHTRGPLSQSSDHTPYWFTSLNFISLVLLG